MAAISSFSISLPTLGKLRSGLGKTSPPQPISAHKAWGQPLPGSFYSLFRDPFSEFMPSQALDQKQLAQESLIQTPVS
jgi:hypothetical protein